MLPKVSFAADEAIDVSRYLATLETSIGRPTGATPLLVIATETPAGVLALPQYPVAIGRVHRKRSRICTA